MRIISGYLGGRKIRTAEGPGMRPAMQKTREALFSMLEARGFIWQDSRILDLFAGSGSLAFEALSRGAAFAALVESSASVCKVLAQNAENLNLSPKCAIYRQDVAKYLRSSPADPFGLVFIDPPYRRGLAEGAIARLIAAAWLAPHAFIIAELEKNAVMDIPSALQPVSMRNFGQTSIHIWKPA